MHHQQKQPQSNSFHTHNSGTPACVTAALQLLIFSCQGMRLIQHITCLAHLMLCPYCRPWCALGRHHLVLQCAARDPRWGSAACSSSSSEGLKGALTAPVYQTVKAINLCGPHPTPLQPAAARF